MGDAGYIQSASGNVCSNENLDSTRAESLHRQLTLVLGFVRMENTCHITRLSQFFHDPVRPMLRACED